MREKMREGEEEREDEGRRGEKMREGEEETEDEGRRGGERR